MMVRTPLGWYQNLTFGDITDNIVVHLRAMPRRSPFQTRVPMGQLEQPFATSKRRGYEEVLGGRIARNVEGSGVSD